MVICVHPTVKSSVHSEQKSWRTKTSQFKEKNKSSRLDKLHFNGLKGLDTIVCSHVCASNDARKVWPLCEHRRGSLLLRTLQVLWDANSGRKRCVWQIPWWQKISKTDLKRQVHGEDWCPQNICLTKIDWSVDTALFHRFFLGHLVPRHYTDAPQAQLVEMAAISIPNLSINSQAAPLRARKSDLLVSFCRSFSCSNAYLHLSNKVPKWGVKAKVACQQWQVFGTSLTRRMEKKGL